jgi:hypothetical protein
MVGDRHAIVRKEGKEVQYNVNRLWKHQPWDEWHPETGMVQKEEDESQKKIVAEHSTEKDSKDEQGKQRILQEGEVFYSQRK